MPSEACLSAITAVDEGEQVRLNLNYSAFGLAALLCQDVILSSNRAYNCICRKLIWTSLSLVLLCHEDFQDHHYGCDHSNKVFVFTAWVPQEGGDGGWGWWGGGGVTAHG